MDAGIDSLKIEGRMKSLYYVATVVQAYRQAIDYYYDHPEESVVDPKYFQELRKVSHRNYTTGFFEHKTTADDQNYGTSSYTRLYDFAGVVQSYDPETREAVIQQRNKTTVGETVEVMVAGSPEGYYVQQVGEMKDEKGNALESTPHPKMIYTMKMDKPVKPMDIIRKKEK